MQIYLSAENLVKKSGANRSVLIINEPYSGSTSLGDQVCAFLKEKGYDIIGGKSGIPDPEAPFNDGVKVVRLGDINIKIDIGVVFK